MCLPDLEDDLVLVLCPSDCDVGDLTRPVVTVVIVDIRGCPAPGPQAHSDEVFVRLE